MEEEKIKNLIRETLSNELSHGLFSARKLADTPTDNLMVTPRGYVNLNGTTANRPNSSVATLGQQFFSTTAGYPLFFNGTSWVSGTGSVVGI